MGRELRRKQAKKEGKSLKVENPVERKEIKNLIIITIVLVLIVVIIYLLSALFITKELDWFKKDVEQTEKLADNTILAAKTFEQKEEEYYVYFYDFKETENNTTTVVNSIQNLKVYKVDTGSTLNKNYISEESNKSAKTLSELSVKAPTLIKVSGDTIVAYYEADEIVNNLG